MKRYALTMGRHMKKFTKTQHHNDSKPKVLELSLGTYR